MQKIFLTVWNVSEPPSSAYQAMTTEGYNLIPIYENVALLAQAQAAGLKVIFSHPLIQPNSLYIPADKVKLDALIDLVKVSPALDGYFLADEPSAIYAEAYKALIDYLRDRDPARFALVNLLPIYATAAQMGVDNLKNRVQYIRNNAGLALEDQSITPYMRYLNRFIDVMQPSIISYDHYGLFPNSDRTDYFLNLGLIAEMAKKNKIPFINFIQASKFIVDWRLPSAQDMRYLVYTSLAYGARGIGYYTYWGQVIHKGLYQNGIKTALAGTVATINAEVNNLSSFLANLDWLGVQHVPTLPQNESVENKNGALAVISGKDFLIGSFCEKNKECSVFMIVNLDRSSSKILKAIIIASGNILQELSRTNGQWITILSFNSVRRFEFRLEPGDGRLFRVI